MSPWSFYGTLFAIVAGICVIWVAGVWAMENIPYFPQAFIALCVLGALEAIRRGLP